MYPPLLLSFTSPHVGKVRALDSGLQSLLGVERAEREAALAMLEASNDAQARDLNNSLLRAQQEMDHRLVSAAIRPEPLVLLRL